MKRRDFLKSALTVAGGGAALAATRAGAQDENRLAGRSFYELRLYHLKRGPKAEAFDKFTREVALPALNRAGVEKVGVFNVSVGPDNPTMYMLLSYSSLNALVQVPLRLMEDADFQSAGADIVNAPATDPAYIRVDSSLLVAFKGMPHVEVPSFPGGGQSRVYELRTYENPSLKANFKKVEMFDRGEIDIFRHAGFQPVFFGDGIIGTRLPSLTYMLAAENSDAREKCWSNFGGSEEWRKLRTTPGYADTELVGDITNVLLRPASYSQI